MVDSTSATLIREALPAINAAFHHATGGDQSPSATNDYGIPKLFEDAFEDDHEIAKIPSLHDCTPEELTQSHGKLVRCLCFVVHSDSEIYGGAFKDRGRWQLGRYGLDSVANMPASDDEIVFEERTSLRCRTIKIPGSSSYVEDALTHLTLESASSQASEVPVDICVKLYNEKEEGLLHACLDVIGILECSENTATIHSIVTKSQRLASLVTSSTTDIVATKEISDIRADLLQKIEGALEGDGLAAELTLLSLISSVSLRSPILVGPLILNLRNVSPDAAQSITKTIADLTCTLPFDMSVENLNKSKLYPSHDGEDYSAGSLQLPTDYTVISNESILSEGKLDERGVKNLQCLTNTINTQELIFHFPFSEFKIPVDLSFITLSHGKSLLPSTISIPLKRSSQWNLNITSSSEQMRHYLARCRLQEVEISEAVSTEVQDDFVRARKQGETIDQTDLSMALALGKQVARSYGRRSMSWEDYQRARSLRKQIVARQGS